MIPVSTPTGGYDVHVGRGLLADLPALLPEQARRVVLVHQPSLRDVAEEVRAAIAQTGRQAFAAEIPDGEEAKTAQVAGFLWGVCGQAEIGRTDLVIGLGGGAATDLTGFVAASTNDLLNIALAERVRHVNGDMYLCVRQRTTRNAALLAAMDIDSTYISTELVAREVLARVLTPVFWQFIEELIEQDEDFATRLRDRLLTRCGTRAPERDLIVLAPRTAPAVCEWLATNDLTVGDLLRHPDDRTQNLPLIVLMVQRGDRVLLAPDDDTPLRQGDQVLVAGSERGLSVISDTLFYPSAVHYVATGEQVPQTWVWRALQRTGRADRPRQAGPAPHPRR